MKKLSNFINRICRAQKLVQVLEFKEKQLIELKNSLDNRNDEVYELFTALSAERRRNRKLDAAFQAANAKTNDLQARINAYEARQQNAIYRDIDKLINEQTVKGLQKYGEAVHADNLTSIEWLNHALEESADKMVYLTALKQTLQQQQGVTTHEI